MTAKIWAAVLIVGSAFFIARSEAQAQVPENNGHTWVARTGTDSTTCGSITAPCRSLSYSISRTLAGGEVECLEAVDSFSMSLTKSLTITCDAAKWSNSSMTSFLVSAAVTLTANDTVILRGIQLDGGRVTSNTYDGLRFFGAGTLILDNVQITGWSGNGIFVQSTGAAKLVVSNSFLAANGNDSNNTGAAIRVVPLFGGTAQVTILNTDVSRNVFGIAIDGSTNTSGINATIRDSTFASNVNDGVVAIGSGSGAIGVAVINSASVNNGFGVRSLGGNLTVRLEGSKVIGNGTGLSGGGAILSLGNNVVEANGANGAFTGSIALK